MTNERWVAAKNRTQEKMSLVESISIDFKHIDVVGLATLIIQGLTVGKKVIKVSYVKAPHKKGNNPTFACSNVPWWRVG